MSATSDPPPSGSSIQASTHAEEVSRGERFEFGRNWKRFLETLDDERIDRAIGSLREMLGHESLEGRTFLDVGSGSGLFSLAARKLGAKVHSFDFDPNSVGCTREIKSRFFADDEQWTIDEASALDAAYVESLGKFDIVYSWGVLHQTGDMWSALDNVARAVADNGQLFISIYNDQGGQSNRWRTIKKIYNKTPQPMPFLLTCGVGAWWEFRDAMIRLVRFQNPLPFKAWAEKKKQRGMNVWHDLVDWVGGYPHEVAKPEAIFDFYQDRGFTLQKMTTVAGNGHGCNEYVFGKNA